MSSVGKGRAVFIIHLNNSVDLTRLDDDVSREAGMVRGKKGGREFVLSEADGGEFVTGWSETPDDGLLNNAP